jgi:hypothetical protein
MPARCFRRLCAASLLLAAVLPAHAFQKTALADGGFEYFFAAPSLEIRGAGDLDLTGLSFIDGVEGGFRVGAAFNLDWLGGENASLGSPLSTWSGVDTLPRGLSIVAGDSLGLGSIRLSLPGGTIALAAGGALDVGGGAIVDVGGLGVTIIRDPRSTVPPAPTFGGSLLIRTPGGDISLTQPPTSTRIEPITPGGGTLVLAPGAGIVVTVLSPVPEPGSATLMLVGMLGLGAILARRARAQA